MKSILQLDRETQLDRQRRLLFCWCYTEAAKTFQPSEYGYRHDRFQMLYETLRIFLFRTVKVYYSHHCYIPNAVAVQTFLWFAHGGKFPAELRGFDQPPKVCVCVPISVQYRVAQQTREEILCYYRFRANNVDKDFTAAEPPCISSGSFPKEQAERLRGRHRAFLGRVYARLDRGACLAVRPITQK